MKSKKVIIIVISIVAAAAIAGVLYYLLNPMNKVTVVSEQIEAMEPVDLSECVIIKDKYANNYTLHPEGENKIVFEKPGTETVNYILTHNGTEKNLQIEFDVVDTTPPKIKVKKTLLQKGDDLALGEIVSVKDKVDGSIDSSQVSVEGDLDTNKSGKYEVTLSVSDEAGNIATKDVTLYVADKKALLQLLEGLWLNNSKSASQAYAYAHNTGLTDVSMTEFQITNNECFMTTMGYTNGEFDGGKVPDVMGAEIEFTYIDPELKTADGEVEDMEIHFDLSKIDKKRMKYKCGKFKTNCAFTEFKSMQEMNGYLSEGFF